MVTMTVKGLEAYWGFSRGRIMGDREYCGRWAATEMGAIESAFSCLCLVAVGV